MNQLLANQPLAKKIYNQPQLKYYGDLRRLTQAGTKGIPEAGSATLSKQKP